MKIENNDEVVIKRGRFIDRIGKVYQLNKVSEMFYVKIPGVDWYPGPYIESEVERVAA